DLVRAQLCRTEWNTGARGKDLAELGGLEGLGGGEISRRRCAARSLDLLRQRQRAVEPPVSLSDVNRHGTDILLQNEPHWITRPHVLLHHKRTGCADRGMPSKVELHPRCEDAYPTRVRRIVLRQDEGRFAEIEFAGNLLHALGRNARRVGQNRQLIAAERCRTENIDDVKWCTS